MIIFATFAVMAATIISMTEKKGQGFFGILLMGMIGLNVYLVG